MTRDEALTALREMAEREWDPEQTHREADQVLLALIDDPDVFAAYMSLERWHA